MYQEYFDRLFQTGKRFNIFNVTALIYSETGKNCDLLEIEREAKANKNHPGWTAFYDTETDGWPLTWVPQSQ